MIGPMRLKLVYPIRMTTINLTPRRIGDYLDAKMVSLCFSPKVIDPCSGSWGLTVFSLAGLRIFEEILEVEYLVCQAVFYFYFYSYNI
jgi:hypothetical protein